MNVLNITAETSALNRSQVLSPTILQKLDSTCGKKQLKNNLTHPGKECIGQ
jgi:hypothetical protein